MLKLFQYDDAYMYYATSKTHLKINSRKKNNQLWGWVEKERVAYKNYVHSKISYKH